ncbi:MAG: hypothetical protein V1792_24295 [Pseudomonadota bacterium]
MNAITRETERQRVQAELDAGETAAERNRLGQYATPFDLALDVLRYAERLLPAETEVSFLDPGFGTGVFCSALLSTFSSKRIAGADGFEFDRHYWEPAAELWRDSTLVIHGRDFTKVSPPEALGGRGNLRRLRMCDRIGKRSTEKSGPKSPTNAQSR